MQTLQFTKALRQIVEVLKAQDLIAFLTPLVQIGSSQAITDGHRDSFSQLFVASSVGFSHLSADPNCKAIMDSLGVSEIYAPERFGRLVRYLAAPGVQHLTGNPGTFVDFYTLLNSLSWLVKLRDTSLHLLETGKLAGASPDDILELRILDYDNKGVEAERVQTFFAGIVEIHSQLSLLLKLPDSRLRILYVDSGSDFVVALQCAKAILDIVRGLLAEFWEKFRTSPLEDFNKRIDSMTKGLSFVGLVKEQVDSGAISGEDGRNLSHRVIQEVTRIAFNGVSLPQDQIVITVDQRKLLEEARNMKLLSEGNSSPEGANGNEPKNT